MRILTATILATMMSQASASSMYFIDGQKLWQHCKAEPGEVINNQRWGICHGFVLGVHDSNGRYLCAPEAATAGQVVDVVRKYLNDNPEIRHLPAYLLVVGAIVKAWPCQRPPSSERPPGGM